VGTVVDHPSSSLGILGRRFTLASLDENSTSTGFVLTVHVVGHLARQCHAVVSPLSRQGQRDKPIIELACTGPPNDSMVQEG
jgi:hypothetical protein